MTCRDVGGQNVGVRDIGVRGGHQPWASHLEEMKETRVVCHDSFKCVMCLIYT